jgi:hypothetical protein
MAKKFRSIFRLEIDQASESIEEHPDIQNPEQIKAFLEKINKMGYLIKLKGKEEGIKSIRTFKPIS